MSEPTSSAYASSQHLANAAKAFLSSNVATSNDALASIVREAALAISSRWSQIALQNQKETLRGLVLCLGSTGLLPANDAIKIAGHESASETSLMVAYCHYNKLMQNCSVLERMVRESQTPCRICNEPLVSEEG